MPSIDSGHGRTQRLLLVNKLLDSRDSASPFTLILDSLEQSARPLIGEYIRRARTNKAKVVFISFDTLDPPVGTDTFIRAYDLIPNVVLQEVKTAMTSTTTRTLLILSTLNGLASTHPTLALSPFLSSLLTPSTSLLSLYHIDQPIPSTPSTPNPYAPPPLTLLRYLATTIMTTHSLGHILASKSARDRSIADPSHGLEEDSEGLLQGLGANDARGVVVDVESRRRSGRGVGLTFFLPAGKGGRGQVMLLEELALYRRHEERKVVEGGEEGVGEVSFSLGLTEKQRRDREGVVLPYFDAQKEGGGGEGGRILYDMGVEDDFDEEEDEI